jgi:urease subunit alpha
MLITCHNLNVDVPTDIAFAQGRARAETMRAEDVLHDIGAISMMTADNEGMGRAGESFLKAIQLAAVNKVRFGRLPEDGANNDNFRIKRYLAKVTINPCIATGVDQYIGSIAPGKLADLGVWRPDVFAVKPEHILKGGYISRANIGDPNGSLMTTQPTKILPQYGAFGANPAQTSYSFVAQAAIDDGLADRLETHQTLMPVHGTRTLSKRDMVHNNWLGNIEIDPESYNVYVDGKRITVKPAKTLPLSQLYFLR